jgi:anaerobic selenocysteine-containing dehydrogenase
VDEAWIEQHSRNAELLWDFISAYTPQAVATVVGVEAERIVQLARDFATAPSASVHMSTGANMGRQGTLAYWLVQMLSLVTGNLGRRGGNIYSPGYFAAATVGKPKQPDPFYPSEFGDMRRVVGSLPGNLLADHIEMGLVKGLICMSGNPLLSMAGENRLRSALASLEFLLVVDIYPNATSLLADYLLPATDWLERSDINSVSLGFQPEPYVQYTDAVVEPQFERKPEWWIFARIQQALGLPSLLDQDDADPMSRANRQLAPHGLSIDELRSRPSNTAILPLPDPGLVFELGVQLEDRKVDCFPALIRRGQDAFATIFDALRAEPEDTLKLITLRTNYMVNSWMHNLQALKREHVLDNPVHVHPADMARLGLEADSEVAVASKHGRVIARLRADEDLRPGVVAMTHGWGHGNNPQLTLASNHPGTNVNELLPSGPGSYDPLSNMAFMTGITVALSAV